MTESSWQLVIDHRRRLMAFGRFLLGTAIMFTMIGIAATVFARAIATMRHLDASAGVSALLPTLPTWWIPEHFAGYALLACVGISGATSILFTKQLDRLVVE